MILPQNYGKPGSSRALHVQPVSLVPKYSLMPLLLGTLKVTLMAMLFATPLSVSRAIYCHRIRSALRSRNRQARYRAARGVIPSVVLGFFRPYRPCQLDPKAF